MRLRSGMTGFGINLDTSYEMYTDKHDLKKSLSGALAVSGFKVVDFMEARTYDTFHIMRFRRGDDFFCFLCHTVHPLLALVADFNMESYNFDFLSHQEIEKLISQYTRYRFLTSEYLNQSVERDMLEGLSPSELEKVKYWNPNTMGELIFNFWD